MMGTKTLHRLWLEDEARIVSFHPMEGWRLLDFLDHGHFMGFLQDLQQRATDFNNKRGPAGWQVPFCCLSVQRNMAADALNDHLHGHLVAATLWHD